MKRGITKQIREVIDTGISYPFTQKDMQAALKTNFNRNYEITQVGNVLNRLALLEELTREGYAGSFKYTPTECAITPSTDPLEELLDAMMKALPVLRELVAIRRP